MNDIHEVLAAHYGNVPAPSNEDLEKQAQVELFAKLAADRGIDLEQLAPEQIQYLFDQTFAKVAEEEKKDEKENPFNKKVEEAKKEHEEKKEAMAKIAEADYLGRVMAHSMVSELRKLSSVSDEGSEKEAGWRTVAYAAKAKELAGKAGDAGKKLTGIQDLADAGKAHKLQRALASGGKGYEDAAEYAGKARNALALRGGAKATGVAAGAAGAAFGAKKLHDHAKEKKSSAIDELAFHVAVEKAASADFDSNEAAERIGALLTLGVEESTKIASIDSLDAAVEIRSLELLEMAGYPVTWG